MKKTNPLPNPTATLRNPRGAGRPPSQETIDRMWEQSELKTLKLLEQMRGIVESAAAELVKKLTDASPEDHAKVVDHLSRSMKNIAEAEGAMRKSRNSEVADRRGDMSGEELLKELQQ